MFTTEFADALKVITPGSRDVSLALVGCGGTGSWLAPAIARIGRWLMDMGRGVDLVFIDPDIVEGKNVFRQNFCDAEIGMYKADALARRYGRAWGLTIGSRNEKLDSDRWGEYSGFGVVCGCVDGPEGRKDIWKMVESLAGLWWLDSGNTAAYGQVLIGRSRDKYERGDPLALPGYTNWLPAPAEQHQELVTSSPTQPESPQSPLQEGGQISCAEMALRDAQGMAINQRMAAEMADYLVQLLITRNLRKYATYIDLESGTCQSKYITKAAVEEWMGGDK